jgi:hypothetical protein
MEHNEQPVALPKHTRASDAGDMTGKLTMTNLKEQLFSNEGRRKRSAASVRERVDRVTDFATKVDLVIAQYPVEEREEIAELLRILTAKPQQFRLQTSAGAVGSRVVDHEERQKMDLSTLRL